MKNTDIEWTHDQELPQGDVAAAQRIVRVITATHKATGVKVEGRPVQGMATAYWLERNRLHDELEKLISGS